MSQAREKYKEAYNVLPELDKSIVPCASQMQ